MNYWWVWVAWVVAFAVAEAKALRNNSDEAFPLTYHIRKFTALGWTLALGIIGWLWLGYHFFIDRGGQLPL